MKKKKPEWSKIMTKELLERLYLQEKVSYQEIANRIGCSQATVHTYLKKYGLTTRRRFKGDLTTKRFGMLTVIRRLPDNVCKNIVWECICDCGKITRVLGGNLGKITNSCGCLKNRKGENNPSWIGYYNISGRFFSMIKSSARKRNIKFDISIEDIWNQYLKQNKKCMLTGLDIYFESDCGQTASIDRIDSSKDYTVDNIQIVHKDINIMKNDYGNEYFILMCQHVANNKAVK